MKSLSKFARNITLWIFTVYIYFYTATPLLFLSPVHAEGNATSQATTESEQLETGLVTVSDTPTPSITKETEVSPTSTAIPTQTPENFTVASITTTPTLLPAPVVEEPVWESENGVYTYNRELTVNSRLSTEELPGVSIVFTKLPEIPGTLTIKKITTTEIVNSVGQVTAAYEISSSMTNGTFEYELTLPKSSGKSSVQYSEDSGKSFQSAQTEAIADNSITIKADHFTLFVVVIPANVATSLCVSAAPNCYTTIQAAINAAANGDTITVDNGTFTENITINKELTINGSGNSTSGTVLKKSTNTPVVTITTSNVTLRNMRITPVEVAGIQVTSNISNLVIDSVNVIGSTPTSATENEIGLKIWMNVSVSGLTITNSQFNNGHYGIYFAKNPTGASPAPDTTSNVTNVSVTDSTFSNNAFKGIYVEKLSSATFTNITASNNGLNKTSGLSANNAGIDVNLKNGNYSNITFNNPTVTGNGLGVTQGKGIAIKGRNDTAGYGLNTTTLSTVTINGGTITGNGGTAAGGGGISIGNNVSNLTINNATISGNNNYGLSNWTTTVNGDPTSTVMIDARYNDWGTPTGPLDSIATDGSISTSNAGTGNAVFGKVNYHPWVGLDITAPAITFNGFRDLPNASYSTTNPIKACGSYNNTGFIAWEWTLTNLEANPVTYRYTIISGPTAVGYTATTTNTHYHGGIPMQGTYVVSVYGTDTAGNVGSAVQCSITYDATAPAAPVITAPTGDYYRTTPIYNAWTIPTDASGIQQYRIEYAYDDGHSFSGGPYRTSTTNFRNHTPAISEQGGVQFRVQAIDNAGNYGAWSTWKHYYYDATAPTTTATGIDANWHNSDVTVTFTCNDGTNSSGCDKTYYIIDGGTPVEGTSVIISTEGVHTVSFYSVDRAGNIEATKTATNTVKIDKTGPATPTRLHFLNTAQTQSFACGVRLQRQPVTPDWDDITGDPTFSHFEYTSFWPDGSIGLNEQVMTSSIFPNTWMPPTDGAFGYAVRSVDFAGNKSAWALSDKTLEGSCQVIYDSNAPVLTLPASFSQEATSALGNNVTFEVSALDPEEGAITPVCTPTSGSLFALGSTTVTCIATDSAGNTTSGSFVVSIVDTTAPTISGFPESITEEANSASGNIVTFEGNASDIVDESPSLSCIPASGSLFPIGAAGTVVTCTATDDAGNSSTYSFTVTIVDSTKPTISELSGGSFHEGDVMPTVTVAATDSVGVARVCFTLDSSIDSADITTPLCDNITAETSHTWDVNTLFGLSSTVPSVSNALETFTFTYWSVDTEGNQSEMRTVTYTVLNVPPTLSTTSAQNANRSFTFSASHTGGNAPVTYSWSSGNFAACTGTATSVTTPTTPGTYNCKVTITDTDGDSTSATITRTVTAPVVAAAVPQEETQPTVTTTPTPTPTGEVLGTRTCSESKQLTLTFFIDKNGNDKYDEGETKVNSLKGELSYTQDGKKVTVSAISSDTNGEWKQSVCAGEYTVTVDTTTLPTGAAVSQNPMNIQVLGDKSETSIAISLKNITKQSYIWVYILLALIAIIIIAYYTWKRSNEK